MMVHADNWLMFMVYDGILLTSMVDLILLPGREVKPFCASGWLPSNLTLDRWIHGTEVPSVHQIAKVPGNGFHHQHFFFEISIIFCGVWNADSLFLKKALKQNVWCISDFCPGSNNASWVALKSATCVWQCSIFWHRTHPTLCAT